MTDPRIERTNIRANRLKAKRVIIAKLEAAKLRATKLMVNELKAKKSEVIEPKVIEPKVVGPRTNKLRTNRRRKRKKPPYIPDDNILGGPADRWMFAGPYPVGEGHTAVVKILADGNHQKRFKPEWLTAYSYMVGSEARGLKAMSGVHAPRYISHNRTSVTMSDVGTHLTAANMPDDWDSQIDSIIQTLKKAGIRHNDIIPRNIMVLDGEIKLIDFSMSTIIGKPFHEPWPNKRLLKIIKRDGDEIMLRRAINYLLKRQDEWRELNAAMTLLGTKLVPGSNTRQGWLYHDVPFNIKQTTHRKHTDMRALAIKAMYDLNDKAGLDLGSSVGGMSFWLNRFGAAMVGVERDPQAIRVARALQNYYKIDEIMFINSKVNDELKMAYAYDFVCYLSTFMWVLKEEGLVGAQQSLKRIGEITDTLFFETSHGDAMAGGAVIKAGLNDVNKMNKFVMNYTGLTNMKEIYIDTKWNNRRLVMFTR